METLTQYAANSVANWAKFESFAWFGKPEDANNLAIFYTSNRDADSLTRSNHTAITERLSKYEDDVEEISHSHWAVGHVDGFTVRVYNNDGTITAAFEEFYKIQSELEDYPVLDEQAWSDLESEERAEFWAGLSIRERIDYLARCDMSILAARHNYVPSNDGNLDELLNGN